MTSLNMTKKETVLGWCLMAAQLLVLPVAMVLLDAVLGLGLSEAMMNIILYSVCLVLTLGVFHRFLLHSARIALAAPLKCLRWAALGLGIYYLGSAVLSYIIVLIDPTFANINDQSIGAMAGEHYTLISVAIVLMVPITEETLYRGLLLRAAKTRFGGYALSMAVFAAIHVLGYIGYAEPLTLVLCFVQYLPAGFALCWAYERAGTIWAPIIMHMTVNQIAIAALR